MHQVIYQKQEFAIYKVNDGFIVHNRNKEFEHGHTHLKSFTSSKNAISFVLDKKIPKDVSRYFLISLMRLAEDDKYISSLEHLLKIKNERNTGKGNFVRRKRKYRYGK